MYPAAASGVSGKSNSTFRQIYGHPVKAIESVMAPYINDLISKEDVWLTQQLSNVRSQRLRRDSGDANALETESNDIVTRMGPTPGIRGAGVGDGRLQVDTTSLLSSGASQISPISRALRKHYPDPFANTSTLTGLP